MEHNKTQISDLKNLVLNYIAEVEKVNKLKNNIENKLYEMNKKDILFLLDHNWVFIYRNRENQKQGFKFKSFAKDLVSEILKGKNISKTELEKLKLKYHTQKTEKSSWKIKKI